MTRQAPISIRPDPLYPYTPPFRSADAPDSRPPAGGQGMNGRGHGQVQPLEIDMRIRRGKPDAGRNLAVPQHENRLDQASDSGRRLQIDRKSTRLNSSH